MLASLFLLWGREAWHLTQLLSGAGLLRVRPQLPGRRRSGFLGALAIATIPLAVGLDAMRQLAFAGDPTSAILPPEVEALILVVMTVVFTLARPLDACATLERRARDEGRLTMRWQ